MNLSTFWITASYGENNFVTMNADDDSWEWDNESLQSIVMPLVTGQCRQIWANGIVYELAA